MSEGNNQQLLSLISRLATNQCNDLTINNYETLKGHHMPRNKTKQHTGNTI